MLSLAASPPSAALMVERRGRVLYLALEDGERRQKARTDALLADAQPDWLRGDLTGLRKPS
jgi:hypothetical protein